ncbi:MAG: DUF1573 domain-containing protein [Bacteroidota bacterium]|nr:DUF1573 domain-containing protein [Bacteroidota bacterium]MDP4212406.1 DUF1573 domain-containing protein [Bacteroidota bacterium]MDP4251270.1 DUF1573 domain-containing protein [Bacteroidota bacterium]
MRLVVLLAFLGCFILSCGGTDQQKHGAEMKIPKDSSLFTNITWLDSTNRNFGTIPEGRKLDVAYRFINSGSKPLIIQRVQPSCGCTVAEQPEEPILPGKEGVIRASFNSEGRVGVNNKSILVFANTRGSQNNEVRFSVVVEKKKW